jgi:hypothetical protein
MILLTSVTIDELREEVRLIDNTIAALMLLATLRQPSPSLRASPSSKASRRPKK